MNSDLKSFCEKILELYPSDLIISESGELFNKKQNINIEHHNIKDLILDSTEFHEWKKSPNNGTLKLLLEGYNRSVEISKLDKELFYVKQVQPSTQEQSLLNEAYRLFFENNITPVFKTTQTGEIIYANLSYAKLFGFDSVEELKKHTSKEFYPDQDVREVYLKELKSKGVLKNFYLRNQTIQGKEIYLLVNVRLLNENDQMFIEGSLLDITNQIEIEKELIKKNEELQKLSTILENISDAVQVVDKNGDLVYLNPVAKDRLGITDRYERKLNILEISPYFKDRQQFSKHFEDIKTVKELVVESVHKNISTGELYPTELSIRLAKILDEEYIIATGRDISQRLIDKENLHLLNNKLKELDNAINSTSLVSITDLKGNILEVNDKFCEVSQYKKEELIGSNHRIVSSNTHTVDFWKKFYSTIYKGEVWSGEICNRKKSGDLYWVRTVIYPLFDDTKNIHQFMSIRQEITKEIEAEKQIHKHVVFQELLVNIALDMINIDPSDLDSTINKALQQIGVFVNADRSYIFDYNTEKETSSNLYEWCNSGVEPQIENLQNVPFKDIPEWLERHFKGEIMDIPNVSELPDSLLRQLLEVQDIKSLIALPMMDGDTCVGFIGFDSVKSLHNYSENDKQILTLFSYMLVNIQKRIQSIRLIESANKQIKDINDTLNVRIAEEKDKTSQLTQSMASLDKMAMIGELTSGLAHDLNTPLGAIKVGAESVRFMLENLFKKVLEGNSIEQIHYACSRAVESNFTMFVGGLQTLKESKAMTEYLDEHFADVPQRAELISLLVKARITTDEPEVIEKIMRSSNPEDFLELIYHIQAIRTFIDTVLEAGEKAKSVIDSLRFYIKEGENQGLTTVPLKENLLKVINVLNHLIKQYDINLRVDLHDGIEVQGFPERLYQLWSNLLKNAIDAAGFKGNITVFSQLKDDEVILSIENTGETIPLEIQKKIWKKFYTTKAGKGTGLGLSIVKRIVEEHYGRIELTSENNLTTFSVYLTLHKS